MLTLDSGLWIFIYNEHVLTVCVFFVVFSL